MGSGMALPSFPSQGQLTEQCQLQAWGRTSAREGTYVVTGGTREARAGQAALAASQGPDAAGECGNGVTGSEQELGWQISG